MNIYMPEARESDSKLIKKIKKTGEELFPLLITIAEELYRFREVSLHEEKSSKLLIKILKEHNFSISIPPVKGLKTHFVAKKEAPGPGKNVAIIAEYDALPEIGHGCGHNLIGASAVTAGIIASRFLERGNLYVIGTPAEEIGRGKIAMIRAGIFDNIDYAIMFHPGNRTRMRPELVALSEVEVKFYGKSAHASSYPDKGINALHGLIQLFNNINAHRQHLTGDFRINGIITYGGEAPNIIPERAEAKFHLRARTTPQLEELKGKFRKMVGGAAKGTLTRARVNFSPYQLMEMKHYPELEDLFRKNLLKIDPEVDLDEVPRGRWASSDIGNLSQLIPTLQATIRITEKPTPIHTREFAEATIKPFALKRTLIAAETLALTALELLEEVK